MAFGAGGIEGAGEVAFQDRDHPQGEVARVDELHGARGISRRHHHAAPGNARGPIREAIGGVVGPHDEPGTNDGCIAAPHFIHHALARRLERAVELRDQHIRQRVRRGEKRAVLVVTRAGEVRVGRDRGDVEVAPGLVAQHLGREADHLRKEARGIHHRVPLAGGKCARQRARIRAVAAQRLHAWVVGPALAAMEVGDLVAAGQQGVGHRTAQEHGAPEHQDAQATHGGVEHGFVHHSQQRQARLFAPDRLIVVRVGPGSCRTQTSRRIWGKYHPVRGRRSEAAGPPPDSFRERRCPPMPRRLPPMHLADQ